jgi:hypothetical protein
MGFARGEQDEGGDMRALTGLTVFMGVLILAGTAVLIAVIVNRATTPAPVQHFAVTLNEPAGTRIAGIAPAGDRLGVELQGGGPDRIVLIDPRSGEQVGRIAVGR